MTGDDGSMESLLSGAGITLAAAAIMLVAIALFRLTGPANASIFLQAAAADVCGDIGTVATSAVPYARNVTCNPGDIGINVSSDYVVAVNSHGVEFARPLPVRIYPGTYRGADGARWNDTAGLREYLNATWDSPGTREQPLSASNGSCAMAMLENASRYMVRYPLHPGESATLTIEKQFLYIDNASSGKPEVEPYVFIYA